MSWLELGRIHVGSIQIYFCSGRHCQASGSLEILYGGRMEPQAKVLLKYFGRFSHAQFLAYSRGPTNISWIVVVVLSLSHVWLFVTPWTADHSLPCPSLSPGVCSNSCPLSPWCHLTISSSPTHFSCCHQSSPASRAFSVSWLFASDGQSIGASASASVLPINTQAWFPLELTGLISLLSEGL